MRVLLIEDDARNVTYFSAVLEGAGHEVTCERDGIQGRERARREAFDVIVTDVDLPGLDGLSIARSIRAAGTATPILALTVHDAPDDLERSRVAGIDLHLSKPISPRDLRDAVLSLARHAPR